MSKPGAPLLLVNPRAGEPTPAPAELVAAARELGVEAHVLVPGEDAAGLARRAADAGAAAVGVAGGDGSLRAIAEVALERDLPFVCVPYGTRNHFARDLGLDRDDPAGALRAFEGEEVQVDVGTVNGRVFVNNVSLGLYASFVHDPARKTRNRLMAFVRMAPAALGKARRPLDVTFEVDGRRERRSALVVLVANNDYSIASMADLGRRTRLDEGALHAYVVEAVDRGALMRLLARAALGRAPGGEGWEEWRAQAFRVERPRPRIHAAVDGDPAVLASPLEIELLPRALRVLRPRTRDRDAEAPADT